MSGSLSISHLANVVSLTISAIWQGLCQWWKKSSFIFCSPLPCSKQTGSTTMCTVLSNSWWPSSWMLSAQACSSRRTHSQCAHSLTPYWRWVMCVYVHATYVLKEYAACTVLPVWHHTGGELAYIRTYICMIQYIQHVLYVLYYWCAHSLTPYWRWAGVASMKWSSLQLVLY